MKQQKSKIPKKEWWCGCSEFNTKKTYEEESAFINHIKRWHVDLYKDFKKRYNLEDK